MQTGSYLYKFLRVFLGAFLLTKVYLAYRLGKCYGAKLLWRQYNIQVSMKINIICNLKFVLQKEDIQRFKHQQDDAETHQI